MKSCDALSPIASTALLMKDCEIIGYSVNGRPLSVYTRGSGTAELRIFILAGQHGDEADAVDAATLYLAECSSNPVPATEIAILPNGNPDGAAAMTRRNASGMDLNRDHLLLRAPETAAIHDFVHHWKPHLIIDVHTYRPWRPELTQHNFIFPQNVMLDFPTNPAIRTALSPEDETGLLSFVTSRLGEAGYRCDRYTLLKPPGIIRHSNVDILDARNGFALRHGAFTVLLEGRRSLPADLPDFSAPSAALLRAIEAVVEWAHKNVKLLRKGSRTKSASSSVPLRSQYAGSKRTDRYMEVQSMAGKEVQLVKLPGQYLPRVKATKRVKRPIAYAVARNASSLLDLLTRQRFQSISRSRLRYASVEAYRIASGTPSPSEAESPMLKVVMEQKRPDLSNYILFPAKQPGGDALSLLLEPESQFGAHRFAEIQLDLFPGSLYPVVRLV